MSCCRISERGSADVDGLGREIISSDNVPGFSLLSFTGARDSPYKLARVGRISASADSAVSNCASDYNVKH